MGSINPVALKTIRELRQPLLTQKAISDLVGIDQSYYSRIEGGLVARPNPEVVRAIAAQLGVPSAAITYPNDECPHCLQVAS